MAKLHDNVKSMQRNCCLTEDKKDLASFKKTTDEIGRTLAEIKTATKVCESNLIYSVCIHVYSSSVVSYRKK